MKVRVEFYVDNEQFLNRDGHTEALQEGVQWVLNQAEWMVEKDGLPSPDEPRKVRDINGNSIGTLEVLS